MIFPADLPGVRYGFLFADSPLVDEAGGPLGRTIPAGSRVEVRDAQPWTRTGEGFRRLYRVTAESGAVTGWIDGSSLALITSEDGALWAGVVPRRIITAGGEAEYSALAIVDAGRTTLIDTSVFPFPDAFRPSGVLRAEVSDANDDGSPEVTVQAETIISLRSLGATPLRWVAWLRLRDGAWSPILQYSESFGTDSGYSYSSTMRTLDPEGAGMATLVRLDTEYVLVSGETEFRSRTVSFYPWSGSSYRKVPLEDLPRKGKVTADAVPLVAAPEPGAAVEATLGKGDELFVFDRSDARRVADDPGSWWYRAVTTTGVEGWFAGPGVELVWIDPLKENRAVLLGEEPPP